MTHFFRQLDLELHTKSKERKTFNPRHLHVVARDAASTWLEVQALERAEQLRAEEERRRQEVELAQFRREQEAILMDPNSSEEDKQFARRYLDPETS